MNPNLLLITEKFITRKVKDLLILMKNINHKHGRASTKQKLDPNWDKLFNISACFSSLGVITCSDRKVSCNNANYSEEHIGYICPQNAKVPIENIAYL